MSDLFIGIVIEDGIERVTDDNEQDPRKIKQFGTQFVDVFWPEQGLIINKVEIGRRYINTILKKNTKVLVFRENESIARVIEVLDLSDVEGIDPKPRALGENELVIRPIGSIEWVYQKESAELSSSSGQTGFSIRESDTGGNIKFWADNIVLSTGLPPLKIGGIDPVSQFFPETRAIFEVDSGTSVLAQSSGPLPVVPVQPSISMGITRGPLNMAKLALSEFVGFGQIVGFSTSSIKFGVGPTELKTLSEISMIPSAIFFDSEIIILNKGKMPVARVNDTTISDVSTDSDFIKWMATINETLKSLIKSYNLHTHGAQGASPPSNISPELTTDNPKSVKGKIISGNETVLA